MPFMVTQASSVMMSSLSPTNGAQDLHEWPDWSQKTDDKLPTFVAFVDLTSFWHCSGTGYVIMELAGNS